MAYIGHSNGYLETGTKSEIKSIEKNTNDSKNISGFLSKELIAAAGFNVKTPIVEAIIGNLTGTLSRKKKSEKEKTKCKICDCELSSNTALATHTDGLKHKKRLKALEIIAQLKDLKDTPRVYVGENPNVFKCEICLKMANSAHQLKIHLSSTKHKKKAVETVSSLSSMNVGLGTTNFITKLIKAKKKKGFQMNSCNICNISVNSQTQYDEHLLSKRHTLKEYKIVKMGNVKSIRLS